ncbi:MAG: hypothetical protein AMXMBFR57_36160 [Acidimicrobiia bacterium]
MQMLGRQFSALPQIGGEHHRDSPTNSPIEEFSLVHHAREHFFEAQRLCTQLHLVGIMRLGATALVFDRPRWLSWREFHKVSNAEQTQAVRAQLHPTFVADAPSTVGSSLMNALMKQPPLNRTSVLGPQSLHVNQRALAFTKLEVLQGRDRQQVAVFLH